MLTYKKTITVPRLEIFIAGDCGNPRRDYQKGIFISANTKYEDFFDDSIDDTDTDSLERHENHRSPKDLYDIVMEHRGDLEAMKDELPEYRIVPVSKFEHGGICYSVGQQFGFDCSNNSFMFFLREEMGNDCTYEEAQKELEVFNKWLNGEVYGFVLYNEEGKEDERLYGFYDIEDIREYLPKEFAEEYLNQYFIPDSHDIY